MRRQFKIQIGADKWTVKYVRRDPRVNGIACDGVCDHAKKTIYISLNQSEEDQQEALVHEWLHARWPEIKEEAIGLAGRQLNEAILAAED